jgi:hypothetical protein
MRTVPVDWSWATPEPLAPRSVIGTYWEFAYRDLVAGVELKIPEVVNPIVCMDAGQADHYPYFNLVAGVTVTFMEQHSSFSSLAI